MREAIRLTAVREAIRLTAVREAIRLTAVREAIQTAVREATQADCTEMASRRRVPEVREACGLWPLCEAGRERRVVRPDRGLQCPLGL